jgi:hypothetical protein
MNRIRLACWTLALAALVSNGCRSSSTSSETQANAATASASPENPQPADRAPAPDTTKSGDLGAKLAEAVGTAVGGPALTEVEADGDCPILYPPPDQEMAAEAKAVVPLKVGLTLSHLWRTIESTDDIECLSHIEAIDTEGVRSSSSCLQKTTQASFPRRTCRTDMRRARVYQTLVGTAAPETIVGATSFSLSRDAFLELKRDGTTRHQYIELRFKDRQTVLGRGGTSFDVKLEGMLKREGPAAMTTIVNEAPTDLPVMRLTGTLRGTVYGKPGETRVSAAMIDDERFPLMLEYRLLDIGSHEFSVRYTKISYPTEGVIEKRLAEAKRVDVYGIYFDFASDKIRQESEPVLKEIGDALQKNADWTLSIEGHTDNVGGDDANLDLSQRRSAAVRAALVQRYGIGADRLTTAGYGERAPKDTNDTPEGRARNRRVELVRR